MFEQAPILQNTQIEQQADLKLLQIMPTHNCDARCKHCHIWGTTGWAHSSTSDQLREQINYDSLERFIDQAMESSLQNTFWVLLTGGEALLYNRITELLTMLRNKGLPTILLTNGSLLHKHIDCVRENVSAVSVSLDGPPKIHDEIRGKSGLFKKVCQNVRDLMEYKISHNKLLPRVTINSAISPFNYSHIEELIEVIKSEFEGLNINLRFDDENDMQVNDIIVLFQPYLFTTSAHGKAYVKQMSKLFNAEVTDTWKGFVADDLEIDSDRVSSLLTNLWKENKVDTSRFVDLKEYFTNINNTFNRTKCLKPWNSLMLREDGDVYFCPDLKDYKIGNIDNSSFNEIWHGEKANKFREVMDNKLLSMCNRCCGLFMDYNYPKISLPRFNTKR